MISALRWLYDGVKSILRAILGLASNLVTWLLAGLAAVSNLLLDAVSRVVKAAFPSWEWPTLSEIIPQDNDLFTNLVHVFALDTAFDVLTALLGLWVTCKLARLAMVPIRALLDIV